MTAEPVRQLPSLVGKIRRTPRPLVMPDPTEIRLQLDRVFARMKGGRL